MQRKGVVVIEEGYSRDEQQDVEYSRDGGQCAKRHNAPYNNKQRPQHKIYAQTSRIAKSLVLELTYDDVGHHP